MTFFPKLSPVFLLLAIVGVAGAAYFSNQYQKAQQEIQTIKTDPSTIRKAAEAEISRLVEEVGRLIELPKDETPTVATVTDAEKLKEQPFFQNTKNGDKVLIYTQAKRAILYDPVAKKIVNAAPVNIGQATGQPTGPKIVLRNGTTTTGLTNKIEPEVKASLSGASIVARENAARNDYEKSVVVALTDGAKDKANKLAADLKITVGDLPAGENRPANVDIVLILGKDKAS